SNSSVMPRPTLSITSCARPVPPCFGSGSLKPKPTGMNVLLPKLCSRVSLAMRMVPGKLGEDISNRPTCPTSSVTRCNCSRFSRSIAQILQFDRALRHAETSGDGGQLADLAADKPRLDHVAGSRMPHLEELDALDIVH